MHTLDANSSPNNLQRNKKLLSSNNFKDNKLFARYSIPLAKRLRSIYAAIILSELVDQYFIARNKNDLDPDLDDGVHWCILDRSILEENTSIPYQEQDKEIHLLTVNGFLQFSKQGRDNKMHFRLSPLLIQNPKELL